jgi:hypothetical protein
VEEQNCRAALLPQNFFAEMTYETWLSLASHDFHKSALFRSTLDSSMTDLRSLDPPPLLLPCFSHSHCTALPQDPGIFFMLFTRFALAQTGDLEFWEFGSLRFWCCSREDIEGYSPECFRDGTCERAFCYSFVEIRILQSNQFALFAHYNSLHTHPAFLLG